ncbi:MAG: hydrogenase formation protein HypD [Planctomycetaceae bacterium]|nr:hydrogenase formation protein HypD [Planctomycetaceae bacterium]
MKHLDEFRDPQMARSLVGEIRRTTTQRRVLMEVCGGQTHSLLRHGIAAALNDSVELIHGPGCPVCVTPAEAIDFAQTLALEPNVLLTSFGDMLRVPGSSRTLLDVRRDGGDVKIVYSPLDAVELARTQPDRHVVFFAVGFETTVPTTALAVKQAAELDLQNFSLIVAHVRVLPAMEAIMQSPGCRVEGFLAAGHVCTITGFEEYNNFADQFSTPVVVTGFEPLDLLDGILECVRQLESDRCEVSNRYARSVQRRGNLSAQQLMDEVYEVADSPWRGLGVIPQGGYRLRSEFGHFDAARRFAELSEQMGCMIAPPLVQLSETAAACITGACPQNECRSGEVLTGLIKPVECAAFGTRCSPESPLGAPMVSAEGACAAYFKYQRTV